MSSHRFSASKNESKINQFRIIKHELNMHINNSKIRVLNFITFKKGMIGFNWNSIQSLKYECNKWRTEWFFDD